ncbi:hypothetical protein [Clostridium sp. JN-9]|uniref:hypothetical protein n=1 Tax=Clostridium sp. JN-9 TaxID=2507159 RepID=UPI000FFE3021|nr:hypothetical protein [Clostridium sp. JN-9]QAT40297.1 hypothetical protein EQM05_08500 [Clostridium sp. JN-9]
MNKNIIKKISCSLILFSLVSSCLKTNTFVHAEEVKNSKEQTETISKPEINSAKIDYIAEMKSKINKNNQGTITSDTEKYVEFTEYKDDKNVSGKRIQIKEYDKAGYLKQVKSEAAKAFSDKIYNMSSVNLLSNGTSVTPGPVTSWLRTSLQVTSFGTGTGYVDVDGFFEWLSAPHFTMTDAVALAHDSNSAFPVENLFCEVGFPQETVNGTRVYPDKYIDQTYASSGYQSNGVTGSGFTFSMEGAYALDYFPYGYMHAKAIRTNYQTTASTVCFAYGHSQYGISVNPQITFPGGASIVIKPTLQVDSVSVQTVATGF